MKQLLAIYEKKKHDIKRRLLEFKQFRKKSDIDLFYELCFCLLTPQSRAVRCDQAITRLKQNKLVLKGTKAQIAKVLKGMVRFHNNKAGYIISARDKLKSKNGKIYLKNIVYRSDTTNTRDWLAKNIKGLGFKEASHFLRNIGLGRGIAILDVHIMRNLYKYKALTSAKPPASRNEYIQAEEKMRYFCKKIKIPMDEMDLLFWSQQTGFIFK